MKLKIAYITSVEVQTETPIGSLVNFVQVVKNPKEVTVYEFKKQLEEVIADLMGRSTIFIALLTTQDGYELKDEDTLNDALQSSVDINGHEEHIIAYDMKSFYRREKHHIDSEAFHTLEKDDLITNIKLSVKVTQHYHGKLCITFNTGNSVPCTFLLSVRELKKIREDIKKGLIKEKVIGTYNHMDDYLSVLDLTKPVTKKLNEKANWQLESKLIIVDKDCENTITVQNTIKTSNDIVPVTVHVPIEWEGKRVKKGREDKAVDEKTDVQEQTLEYFKSLIPEPIIEGEQLEDSSARDLIKYEDSGDSDFHLMIPVDQQNEINTYVTCNQDTFERDGKFNNYFFIPGVTITLKRDSSSILSIVKLQVDYQDRDSKWKPMHTVNFGSRYKQGMNWRYKWFDECNVNMRGGMSDTLAVRGAITVNGTPGDDNESRAKAHSSLPQPLKLKVKITDSEGKSKELIVEQANKTESDPLDLPTLDERAKAWGVKDKSLMRMVHCDNTSTIDRIYTACYIDEIEKAMVIRYSYGPYFILGSKKVKSLELEKKEEIELENQTKENRDGKWQTFAKFDTKTGVLYALRIVLQTSTGKRDEVVLVKDILDEAAKLQ
ncbi:hypothetical protein ABK040_002831 [Willaertia magna]